MSAPDVFTENQAIFEESDGTEKGLGPTFNARSCADCHQTPVTGGSSQVSEFRVGHTVNGRFVNPSLSINHGQAQIANRSLVNDRTTCAEAQAVVPTSENVRTFRMSLSVLGDGFIEAIDDSTLRNIAQQQRSRTRGFIAGQAIDVPILEAATPTTRVGRFGWKSQHASLLSFAADAYLNEQGITSRLQPTEATSVCDTVPDPEDEDNDIDHFADFMRGTLAPPVDDVVMATSDAQAGKQVFTQIGCALCHVSSITTAPAGTSLNGGTFIVPAALGNKTIHPYSDFLLHNIDTGDGIQQNAGPETANKLRTPPLWGLRTRDRLMHDGLSVTRDNAIARHGGEASFTRSNFFRLSQTQRSQLLKFLSGL
jgi:CxxC motif-containing protein (DUF1111 family)